MKGLEYVTNLRKSERHCHSEICFPKEDEEVDKKFWDQLGGKPDTINPPTSDNLADAGEEFAFKLYKVSNDSGKLMCSVITERPLKKEMLETGNTYILETYKNVQIWIGKEADVEEKKQSLVIGKGLVKKNNKPKGTRVTRICERCEDAFFKSFFNGFYPIAAKKPDGDEAEKASALATKKAEQIESLMTQLGDYTVKVYLCKDGQNIELPEEAHGFFFQNEVYLIDV